MAGFFILSAVGDSFLAMKLSSMTCGGCGSVGTMRKIVYGMPSDGFDFEKYAVGGCMPSEAKYECRLCEWRDQ